MRKTIDHGTILLAALAISTCASATATGSQTAMWGFTPQRNMVIAETGLADRWDLESGQNIKWTAELGSQTYGGPLVVGGQVFVGTNNQRMRNPKLAGDRGVVMAFRAEDGAFLWQSTHTKLPAGRVNDWPQQGICSTPFVEGDRLYYVSNRCELVSVDTNGFRDGENDGPFTQEEENGPIDADLIWVLDMIDQLGVFPHNLATCSPVGAGELLFVVTGNGVDEGHVHIPTPFAPSFIAVNKKTGAVAWESTAPGERILHGQWSNPAYGTIAGKEQVIFPGGDGWVYAYEPTTGRLIWKFDANPKDAIWELGGAGRATPLSPRPWSTTVRFLWASARIRNTARASAIYGQSMDRRRGM